MKQSTESPALQPIGYTAREAMELLHLGPTTFYALIKDGKLRAHRTGHKYLVTREELERFVRGEDAA